MSPHSDLSPDLELSTLTESRHTTSPKEGETAVYGYNPALFWVLSVWCWCLEELIFT